MPLMPVKVYSIYIRRMSEFLLILDFTLNTCECEIILVYQCEELCVLFTDI